MNNQPKSVLITGATGKLGSQFVKGFSELGYNIAFTSRNISSSKKLRVDALDQGAQRVECIEIDLKNKNAVSTIMNYLQENKFYPDILINNARDIQNLKVDDNGIVNRDNWERENLLNVIVPYDITMALSNMTDSKLKNVINIASIYGITAPNTHLYKNPTMESPINYGVTKAALIHLSKELAIRLAPKDIRVNTISYGGIEGRVDKEFMERYGKLCPMNRMLKESEVFGAVQFLSSDSAQAITGHNLVVDGGWTVW